MRSLNSPASVPPRAQGAGAPSSRQSADATFTQPLDTSPAPGSMPLASPASARAHWLDPLKRWSSAFMPPLLGILLLLLALLFASQRGIVGAPTIAPTTLVALVALYLALGMIWGVCLYFATDTLRWLLVTLGGVAAYALATAAVYWGLVGALVIAGLFLWIFAWYSRQHRQRVPADNIAFTSFAGAHLRDLTPGSRLLAPGERILKIAPVREQTLVCGPVQVRAQAADGRAMLAHAAAVIAYRLWRDSAFQAEFFPDEWARLLRESAEDALRLSLEEWAQSERPANPERPASQLARLFRRALRDAPDLLDLRIGSVQVQDVSLELDRGGAVAQSAGTAPTDEASDASFLRPTTPLGPQAPAAVQMAPTAPANTATPPPMPDVLDPTVLTEAYQAIAEQRITDPATIRAIAEAFAALARDRIRSEVLDFDAEAASRILLHHAAKLDGQKK